jgi:hypothetical protein
MITLIDVDACGRCAVTRFAILVGLLMMSFGTPIHAQAGDPPARPSGGVCYDINVTRQNSPTFAVGRVSFDTVAFSGSRPLQFSGGRIGFGAPRGTWRPAPGDSLTLVVTFIDSGIRIAFPRLGPDTVRGSARDFGLARDTVTVYPALAVRQTSC